MTKASFEAIVATLNNSGVRYLVVGGIAVNAHGFMRLTVDVDLLIQLEEANIVKALRALEQLGYRPTIPVTAEDFAQAGNRQRWITEKQMKVLKLYSEAHRETGIDIFIEDPLGFNEAYKRVHSESLSPNLMAPVCSYEDLVKLKKLAARPKDISDLETLRKIRGER